MRFPNVFTVFPVAVRVVAGFRSIKVILYVLGENPEAVHSRRALFFILRCINIIAWTSLQPLFIIQVFILSIFLYNFVACFFLLLPYFIWTECVNKRPLCVFLHAIVHWSIYRFLFLFLDNTDVVTWKSGFVCVGIGRWKGWDWWKCYSDRRGRLRLWMWALFLFCLEQFCFLFAAFDESSKFDPCRPSQHIFFEAEVDENVEFLGGILMLEIGIGVFVFYLCNSFDWELIVLILGADDAVDGDGSVIAADTNLIVLNFFDF